MSKAQVLIDEVKRHGCLVTRHGPDMLRVVGNGQIPEWLMGAILKNKVELVSALSVNDSAQPSTIPPTTAAEFSQVFDCWPWQIDWLISHPGRATLKPEVLGKMSLHWCPECGRWASVGVYGKRFCVEHAPKF